MHATLSGFATPQLNAFTRRRRLQAYAVHGDDLVIVLGPGLGGSIDVAHRRQRFRRRVVIRHALKQRPAVFTHGRLRHLHQFLSIAEHDETANTAFEIGFGLFVGYPVAYPYYYYPYAYPAPVRVPGPTGGLSFDITPSTAEIYIDGEYVGLVEDYSATMQPFSLAPGRHRVEIREAGFETLTFDVDVLAGQVIPFQGAMEPQ